MKIEVEVKTGLGANAKAIREAMFKAIWVSLVREIIFVIDRINGSINSNKDHHIKEQRWWEEMMSVHAKLMPIAYGSEKSSKKTTESA